MSWVHPHGLSRGGQRREVQPTGTEHCTRRGRASRRLAHPRGRPADSESCPVLGARLAAARPFELLTTRSNTCVPRTPARAVRAAHGAGGIRLGPEGSSHQVPKPWHFPRASPGALHHEAKPRSQTGSPQAQPSMLAGAPPAGREAWSTAAGDAAHFSGCFSFENDIVSCLSPPAPH